MLQPTINEVLLVLIERYRADRKAAEAINNHHSRKLAQVTLDSFMNNIAAELRSRFGLTLEWIAP